MIFLAVLISGGVVGCATPIIPVMPSAHVHDTSPPVRGIRFSQETLHFREPGLPLSTGQQWRSTVGAFAADRLNAHISAEPSAPAATTTVTLDMISAGFLDVGGQTTLSIGLSSTLPDGRRVVTAAETSTIESDLEYCGSQCIAWGGPVFELGALVTSIIAISNLNLVFPVGGFLQGPQSLLILCGCMTFSAGLALVIHGGQWLVSTWLQQARQKRASDLLSKACASHAEDVRRAILGVPDGVPPTLNLASPPRREKESAPKEQSDASQRIPPPARQAAPPAIYENEEDLPEPDDEPIKATPVDPAEGPAQMNF